MNHRFNCNYELHNVESLRELMGRKYAIDVLIFVLNNPGSMQKTITDHGGEGKVARRDRLNELVAAGLIYNNSSGVSWTAIRYYLTDEGARIARGWMSIEQGSDNSTDQDMSVIKGEAYHSASTNERDTVKR